MEDTHQEIAYKIKTSPLPFALLLLAMIAVSVWLMGPLLVPLAWSALFAYCARPLYEALDEKLFNGKCRNLSAAITSGLILLFIALPIIGASFSLFTETTKLYRFLIEWIPRLNEEGINVILGPLQNRSHFMSSIISTIESFPHIQLILTDIGTWLARSAAFFSSTIVENGARLIYGLIIVAITCFFFVRDGDAIVKGAMKLLPMPQEGKVALLKRTRKMLSAVVFGVMFTAAVQAVLGGLGWWFVKLPHPVIFSGIMFLTAMIPFVGTPIIWVPGAIVLFIAGDTTGAVLLFAWGICAVSMVDNFIRPIFISEGSRMHMLPVLIGVFGGLARWGFLGIFIGPLIMSLTLFMIDAYGSIVSGSSGSNPWSENN